MIFVVSCRCFGSFFFLIFVFLFADVVIIVNIHLLVVCVVNAKKVPLQIKQQQLQPLSCQYKDFFYSYFSCDKASFVSANTSHRANKCAAFQVNSSGAPAIFLFYDVNSVEGFNLRRDVYIRMAVFLKSLRKRHHYANSYLVLPPFYQLYHWNLVTPYRYRNDDINTDDVMFWNHFFDLPSMKRYTAILDLWEYFEIMRDCFGMQSKLPIDNVFRLQHFESMFQSGKFEEKFEVKSNCDRDSFRNRGQFLSLYSNFSIKRTHCVEFQGSAGLLYNLLEKYQKR